MSNDTRQIRWLTLYYSYLFFFRTFDCSALIKILRFSILRFVFLLYDYFCFTPPRCEWLLSIIFRLVVFFFFRSRPLFRFN